MEGNQSWTLMHFVLLRESMCAHMWLPVYVPASMLRVASIKAGARGT